ncbi:MAG: LPS export ABC transporter periplasmic protein LptC [Treponema sp.]|nr:LPS export ABC transporter periplasmic protein LptC [Treponema sp.]
MLLLFPASCSFDYGSQEGSDKSLPDIIMEDVDYVRVRSADLQARFQAERAERYEERRIMQLWNFSFEQYGNQGDDVNAYGRAGSALVEIDSGDISLGDGVRIEVESEDIILETKQLEWKDEARTLSGGDEDEVIVNQSDGTSFTGIGFSADARRRKWEFTSGASGTYIHEDDKASDDGESEAAGETEGL